MPVDRTPTPSVKPASPGKAKASPKRTEAQSGPAPYPHAFSPGSPARTLPSSRKKKRAPNAFMLFRSFIVEHEIYPPELTHQSDVSRFVAKLWNVLPGNRRDLFYHDAKLEKVRFEAEQPLEVEKERTKYPFSDLVDSIEQISCVQDVSLNQGDPELQILHNAFPSELLVQEAPSTSLIAPTFGLPALWGPPATQQTTDAIDPILFQCQSDFSFMNDPSIGAIQSAGFDMNLASVSLNWPLEPFDAQFFSAFDPFATIDATSSQNADLPWEMGLGLDFPPPLSFSYEDLYGQSFPAFNA